MRSCRRRPISPPRATSRACWVEVSHDRAFFCLACANGSRTLTDARMAMFVSTGVARRELEAAGRKLVRRDGKQVLLLALEDRVFAIANRCPHEGYPLSEGTEGPGCVLTC